MPLPRSPLAPDVFPEILEVPGVRLAVGAAGIRYRGRDDLLLVALEPETTVAGVFTRNAVPGHPVTWCRQILSNGRARALIVNAGNANVMNGHAGDRAVQSEAEAVAGLFACAPDEVFVASTGVIGEALDTARIAGKLPNLVEALGTASYEAAANAIGTTDTFPKGSVARARIGHAEVTIAGIAKGSGMIQPDMATMLAFVFTDARIPAPVLQELLNDANAASFSHTTVDSDTSTSDTLLLFATGQADHALPTSAEAPELLDFRTALRSVCQDLAKQVVRDGEGAQKFVTVAVRGASDDGSAKRIGLAIGNSPLVKTAIAGADANWGRIAMAVGKSGEPIALAQLTIAFGGHVVARDGARVPDLNETPVTAHLEGREVLIEVAVGNGPGSATVWTCDLTHGYISINADYRS